MADLPTLTGLLTMKFTRVHSQIQLPICGAENIVFECHECNNSCSVLMNRLLFLDWRHHGGYQYLILDQNSTDMKSLDHS